jgi:peptidoglycan hydrolase-like protein with peptidoglycan-binding domain
LKRKFVVCITLCLIFCAAVVFANDKIEKGMTGNPVVEVQQLLIGAGYLSGQADGIFGDSTENAVKVFQQKYRLTADGIVGNDTLWALRHVWDYNNSGSVADSKQSSQLLKEGARGSNVVNVQQLLINAGYLSGTADGIFGDSTESAICAFQRANGLMADGIVGTATLSALQSSSADSTITSDGNVSFKAGDQGDGVSEIQGRLINNGFNPGGIDGVYGGGTVRAISEFQARHNLQVTGMVDDNTKRALYHLSGAPLSYKQKLTMHATAYTVFDTGNSGYTANGNRLQRGLVSVDPNEIPLGTQLYIEGYGYALADDTGSVINGDRIDLAMNTRQEALQFGYRDVVVYIL